MFTRFESIHSIIRATEVLILSSFFLKLSEVVKSKRMIISSAKKTFSLITGSIISAYLSSWRNSRSRMVFWISKTLELVYQRPEVISRGYEMPDLTPLREWIANTKVLSAAAIEEYAKENPDMPEVLKTAARWSKEVDENIERIVHGIIPFPSVKATLSYLGTFADVVVVSATPHEALFREWQSCGLTDYVTVVAGQELGTKAQCIKTAMQGRYDKDHVLKIGDAPGDYEAAKQNGVLFCPIIPGSENESWDRILHRDADLFKNLEYGSKAMDENLKAFFNVLLDSPPWNV